jgi:hypothetical protein
MLPAPYCVDGVALFCVGLQLKVNFLFTGGGRSAAARYLGYLVACSAKRPAASAINWTVSPGLSAAARKWSNINV